VLVTSLSVEVITWENVKLAGGLNWIYRVFLICWARLRMAGNEVELPTLTSYIAGRPSICGLTPQHILRALLRYSGRIVEIIEHQVHVGLLLCLQVAHEVLAVAIHGDLDSTSGHVGCSA